MAGYVHAGKLAEIKPGQRKTIWVSGVKVLVLNVDGQVFAVDEQCTHMQCSLMNGPVHGTIIECPCHYTKFDLRDGKVLQGPANGDLPTFKVKIENGEILVEERPPEIV